MKIATPTPSPWKKSSHSFPATPPKSWGPVKPPLFWKIDWRFNIPPPCRKGGWCTLWGWNRGPFIREKLQILPINVLFPPNELYDTYVDIDDDLQLHVNICNNLVAEVHAWSILTVPIYFTIFPFSKTQLSIYNVICTFLVKYYLKSPLY